MDKMTGADTYSSLRDVLRNRIVTIGGWMQIGHPAIAEIFSNAGFNWIAVDGEHTDISIESFSNIARAMHGRRSAPIMRVRENDTLAIRQALDVGAMGVIIPLVNTAEEAQKAVAAARYSPEGIRGYAFCRANNWGIDFDEYVKSANDEIAVIVMIESKQAVENIDDILGVEGVDGIFVGPYDLSGSYGVTGQISHPLIENALKIISEACKKHGRSAGLHAVLPTEQIIRKAIQDGFTFIALGMDTIFLNECTREVIQITKMAKLNEEG